jgi:hypothetical protein
MPNPEGTIGRDQIRKETDAFLAGASFTPITQVVGQDILQVLQTLGIAPTTQQLLENGGLPNPSLTGAIAASLPMRFSISDANNNGLVFTMLINPTTMNHGKTGAVYLNYARNGYISQMWGPNQDLITATGTSAAFMVDGEGLTAVARSRSFGLLNFLALVGTYRNNGYELLDPSALKGPLTRVINKVHGVEMYYDGQVYMGHFNNFTIDELADKPFVFDYNFEFVCSMESGNYNEVKGHFTPQAGGLAHPPAQPNSSVLVGGVDDAYLITENLT